MKNVRIWIAILCAMALAACGGQQPATKDETSEMQTSEEVTQEEAVSSLKSERETGMTHPIDFAEDMKIVPEEARLTRTTYDLPAMLDETHEIRYGGPLARGKIGVAIEVIDDPGDGRPADHRLSSLGYYDLKEKKIVVVAETEREPYSNSNARQDMLFPMDEEHILYMDQNEDEVIYSIYTIADGTLTELARFQRGESMFEPTPYADGERIYLVAESDGRKVVHVYDAKTHEKLRTIEGYDMARSRKDGEVLGRNINVDGDHWTVELLVDDVLHSWESEKGEHLMDYGVGNGDAVYALTRYDQSDKLEEDLTEDDRKDLEENIIVPYFELTDLDTGHVFARERGENLLMSTSQSWVALWRDMGEDRTTKYLLLPAANEVVRITNDKPTAGLYLLPFERYGVMKEVQEENRDTVTVHVFEPVK